MFQNKFRSIVLNRAYGDKFCLAFSQDRCNEKIELDRGMFDDEVDFSNFIDIVQRYGEQNMAIVKVSSNFEDFVC